MPTIKDSLTEQKVEDQKMTGIIQKNLTVTKSEPNRNLM
jgi:hypothetical protein